jgi:hypothetical protein
MSPKAGDGNRTRIFDLEGQGSTIKQRPHNHPALYHKQRFVQHLKAQRSTLPDSRCKIWATLLEDARVSRFWPRLWLP